MGVKKLGKLHRGLLIFFIFSCVCFFFTDSAKAQKALPENNVKPVLWAADAEGGAPYVFVDPKNPKQRIGFEVDLAEDLARHLNRPVNLKQYAFSNLVSGLERGDFDIAMNGIELTPDRKEKLRLSRPYYVYKLQLVARVDDVRFDSLEKCREINCKIGTLEETAAERLLDSMQIKKRVYDGQVEAYSDLELGRLDAVLMDLPIAIYYAQPNPKLRFVGAPTSKGYYVIALQKENEALAKEIDIALGELIKAGELRRILEKWQLWNGDQLELETDIIQDIASSSRRAWTIDRYLPLLLQGALVTVKLTFAGMFLAVLFGLPIALLRLYGPAPLRWFAIGYVEFFRGIPVLLLLYFLYYGLPSLSINLGPSITSSITISPESISVKPFKHRRRVDFPPPLGPMIARISPALTLIEIPFNTA